jgi:hypothetical protein
MTALFQVRVLALSLLSCRKQVAAQEESVQLKRLSGTFVDIPGENSEEPVAKGLDRGPQLVEQRLTAIEGTRESSAWIATTLPNISCAPASTRSSYPWVSILSKSR